MADLAEELNAANGSSPHARMIPGGATAVGPRECPPAARVHPDFDSSSARSILGCGRRERRRHRSWLFGLLPQPQTHDLFALYHLVFLDLVVLVAMCFVPRLLSSTWAIPWSAAPVYAVLVTLFGFSEGLYRKNASASVQVPIILRSAVLAMVLITLVAWKDLEAAGAVVSLASSLAGLLTWRRLLAWQQKGNDGDLRHVLIVGATPAGRAIARALGREPLHRTIVHGFVDDYVPLSADVLGRLEDLVWLTRGEFIDEVIIALPRAHQLAQEIAQVAYRNHLDIRAVPDLPAGFWPDADIDRIGGVPLVTLHREPMPSLELLLKRLLDVMGALIGLLISLPIMTVVAAAIRLESTGPIFYSALRTGTKGRRFRCHKFRSMAVDADRQKDTLRSRNQRQGPTFKIEDDPRITRIGRFIRHYSLDELPQLWNVLRGDMSLVGPRPHPVDDVSQYELHHYRRLDVKPGLTGLWQVTARSNPSFELNLHLDLTYIENWTLLLDLRILMRTVRVLFAPEGA